MNHSWSLAERFRWVITFHKFPDYWATQGTAQHPGLFISNSRSTGENHPLMSEPRQRNKVPAKTTPKSMQNGWQFFKTLLDITSSDGSRRGKKKSKDEIASTFLYRVISSSVAIWLFSCQSFIISPFLTLSGWNLVQKPFEHNTAYESKLLKLLYPCYLLYYIWV